MAMSQQLSLRVPCELRKLIRARLEEMRRTADKPEEVTEADAARSLILDGARSSEAIHGEQ